MKDGVYVMLLALMTALYSNGNYITDFDSLGADYVSNKVQKFWASNITKNIYRIQKNYSIMFGYFCIGIIQFMVAYKSFLDYTNFIS